MIYTGLWCVGARFRGASFDSSGRRQSRNKGHNEGVYTVAVPMRFRTTCLGLELAHEILDDLWHGTISNGLVASLNGNGESDHDAHLRADAHEVWLLWALEAYRST